MRMSDWISDVCSSDLFEQIFWRGSRGIIAAEHRITGEEDREDEAVAHQIDPEAQHRAVPFGMRMLVEIVEARGFVGGCEAGRAHVRPPPPRAGGSARPRPPRPSPRECRNRACS